MRATLAPADTNTADYSRPRRHLAQLLGHGVRGQGSGSASQRLAQVAELVIRAT
jgi:hypothetical protein